MAESKKRVIKSLETLSEELKELIKKQYPNGYEASITRITNAKKEPIFVFPLETIEATYLIKIPFTKNSEGEYDVEVGGNEEFAEGEGPGYNERDEFSSNDNGFDDEEGGERQTKDPGYDPDFDN